MLLLPRDFARGTLLALHEFGHTMGQVIAGYIRCNAFGFLPRRAGAVPTICLAVVGDADLAFVLSVSECCPGHRGHEDRDECDAGDHRPFSFGLRHNLCSHEKIAHPAELVVALLHSLGCGKR